MSPSQALLVLGPHRSGTSAFARVLNLLGVDLGSEMLRPKSDNRLGFWEHGEIFEIHEQLLDHLGSSWHDYRPLSPGWHREDGVARFRARLRSFLDQEFEGERLWGVKDPRACRLLPLWLEVLKELGIDAGFVIVVRNPLEVVRSLATRNQFSPNKGLLLYLSDQLAAIYHTEGLRRVFVSYERLLEDWSGVVTEIGRELRLDWPYDPAARGDEIESFLRPSERHHRHTLDDLDREPFVPGWCRNLQKALDEACRGHGDGVSAAFSVAYDSFLSASTLFVPEIDRLEHRMARLSAAHVSAEQEVSQLRRQLEEPAGDPEEPAGESPPPFGAEDDAVSGVPARSLEQRNAELREALEAAHRERAVLEERQRQLERRARRAEDELQKVQKHLTSILSGRLYRYTRRLRRGWYRLSRFS